MIDHWLDERGQKAIEKMGWPEWRDQNGLFSNLLTRVRRTGMALPHQDVEYWTRFSGVRWDEEDEFTWSLDTQDSYPDYIALAILRDHALEYLEAFATRHACCLSIASPGSGYEHWYIAIRGHGRPVVEIELADFDAALVATIHAVEN